MFGAISKMGRVSLGASGCWLVGAALAALGCGGQAGAKDDAGSGGAPGGTGATSGETAAGGAQNGGTTNGDGGLEGDPIPSGSGGASQSECSPGERRCNGSFERELCTEEGRWRSTDFACARNVSVDDQTGGICVTKADGTYICRGGNVNQELPPGRYQRVQATTSGLVGLDESGKLVAPEMLVAPDLPRAVAFRSTMMGSDQAICALFEDGSFKINIYREQGVTEPQALVRTYDGTFKRVTCAYEGLFALVRADGSLQSRSRDAGASGNEWSDVALSNRILCALDSRGSVKCLEPEFTCAQGRFACVDDPKLPSFPGAGYRSIAATFASACAVSSEGALVCQRYDGVPMLTDPGPYTFADGGLNVVCAVREDGGVTCFQHQGAHPLGSSDPGTQLEPIDPPLGPEW